MSVDWSGMSSTLGLAAVAVPALVVRLASLPLLHRAQRDLHERESAARAGSVSPWGLSGAGAGELVLGLVGGAALFLWLGTQSFAGFDMLSGGVLGMALGSNHAAHELAMQFHLTMSGATNIFFGIALTLLALWLLLWFLTQRNLRSVGMPASRASGAAQSVGPRLALLGGARLALGLVLPIGLVVAALVVQLVAALASRRVLPAVGAPAPGAGLFGPGVGTPGPAAGVFGPPQGFAPGPPSPYAPTASAYVPAATTPPVPASAPGRHSPYPSASAGPHSPVSYQELHPNEPRTIAGYHLIGRIGSGGMGTVYLARREGSATQVALKTIHPELLDHPELLRRFARESEVLAMVPGAYTARVLDSGVEAGRPYLAMELLDGRPLDTHLREQGPLRAPEALRALALALATALSGVHRLGLVHRDLKPANIMLTTAGPRLLDFGIAALVDGTRLTRTGGGPGTLTYMAPEQFGDEPVGTAADIWAWACCVVCAAHGTSPFQATSTGAVIRRIVDTGPAPEALEAVRALDPALADAVRQALTADPAGRPADGAALVALLTADRDPGDIRAEITRGWQTMAV
ncbi:protein kinase [Streptomyces sp. NPDC058657]|uniref:serine/threonine-protein kinase n=1 Tax=unclassified Streptomyces TaxID=2593676 RepID=UPI003664EE77